MKVRNSRRRTRRSRDISASVPQIVRRFKEMLCDGFGLIPNPATDTMIRNLQKSFALIHRDQKFWNGLSDLSEAKRKVQIISVVLKGSIK